MSFHLTRRMLWFLAALGTAALLIGLADWLILTDAERIEDVMDELRYAVEHDDHRGVLDHLSADFRAGGMTREMLGLVAKSFFDDYGPVRLHRYQTAVKVSGRLAVVEVRTFATAGGRRGGGLSSASTWQAELRKEADDVWRVTALEPVRVNGRDVAAWQEVWNVNTGGF